VSDPPLDAGVDGYVVHGVRASASGEPAALLARLREDFAPFAATLAKPPHVTLDVGPSGASGWAAGQRRVMGLLGDEVAWDEGGRLAVRGPGLERSDAYLTEVRPYFAAAVLGRLTAERRAQQVHASGVVVRAGTLLFLGDRGAGKTSLALAAIGDGASHLASDIALLEQDAASVRVLGLPQTVTLGPGAARWFAEHSPGLLPSSGAISGEKLRVPADALAVQAGPVPLAGMMFPEPAFALDAPRAQQLAPGDALVRLVSATQAMSRWQWPPPLSGAPYLERLRDVCLAAVEQAPAWHVQWCRDHRRNARLLAELISSPALGRDTRGRPRISADERPVNHLTGRSAEAGVEQSRPRAGHDAKRQGDLPARDESVLAHCGGSEDHELVDDPLVGILLRLQRRSELGTRQAVHVPEVPGRAATGRVTHPREDGTAQQPFRGDERDGTEPEERFRD
jgi:hypothetical protein